MTQAVCLHLQTCRFRQWLTLCMTGLVVLACLVPVNQARAADVIGRADLVVGLVQVQQGKSSSTQKLSVGQMVQEGQTLITGSDGYLYINTVDKGFISLRPNSKVTVELYRYNAQNPKASQIRLVLHQGVMRSISGQGAQAAKDKYRLNTPVAAIGIRGTDFTVFANQEVTRATVSSGGIVMAPLGGTCASNGLGPCEGSNSLDLKASPAAVMQVTRGELRPVMMEAPEIRPDKVAPPRSDESAKAASLTTSEAPSKSSEVVKATSSANPTETVVAPNLVGNQGLFWGRWQAFANLPAQAVNELKTDSREWVALLGPFIMTREISATPNLPTAGQASFVLKSYEAYFVNSQTNLATPAQIRDAQLTVNFDRNTFDTGFGMSSADRQIQVNAQGVVGRDGALISTFNQAGNTTVRGALTGVGGQQAGYLFNQTLDPVNSAVGATRWSR